MKIWIDQEIIYAHTKVISIISYEK